MLIIFWCWYFWYLASSRSLVIILCRYSCTMLILKYTDLFCDVENYAMLISWIYDYIGCVKMDHEVSQWKELIIQVHKFFYSLIVYLPDTEHDGGPSYRTQFKLKLSREVMHCAFWTLFPSIKIRSTWPWWCKLHLIMVLADYVVR